MVLFAHFLKTSKFIPACISIYILSLVLTLYQDASPHPLPGYQSSPSNRIPVITLYPDTSPNPLPGYQSSPSTRILVPTLFQDTSPHPLPGYQSSPSTRILVPTLYQDTSPHPLPGYQSSPSIRILVPTLYQEPVLSLKVCHFVLVDSVNFYLWFLSMLCGLIGI